MESLLRIVFLFTCVFFSVHVQAAQAFTYTEFTIAFILGLMLPVLLIIVLLKPLNNIRLRYPALISSSSLLMLFALAYLTQHQSAVLLTSAMIFSSTLFFWLRTTYSPPAVKMNYVINFTVVAATFAFIAGVWLLPNVDAYFTWLISSSLILLCAGYSVYASNKVDDPSSLRLAGHWLVHLIFVVMLFAWLNAFVSASWLVSIIGLSYLIALINGCWFLVNAVRKGKFDEQEVVSVAPIHSLDPATNLPVQQQAKEHIKNTVAENQKSKTIRKYAAVVFKPINFQSVNSVLGHQNSDILLLQLAYCLQQATCENNKLINFNHDETPIRVARLQGLHFLVVLELQPEEQPESNYIDKLCRDLTASVPNAMSFKSFSLNFNLAFGTAFIGEHSQSISEVLSFAEDALLRAEQTQVMLNYFDQQDVIFNQQKLEKMERLNRDLLDEKLHWYLQPQVHVSTKEIIGFQMMVHWYGNESLPEEFEQFHELAELSGDVYLLTKQMVKKAFEALTKLSTLNCLKPVTISLSSNQLLEPSVIEHINEQVNLTGIAPKYLTVELKESVILSASHKAKAIIDQLTSLEVQIAIGDFSGSYEALRYLRKVAIQQVKINCSAIDEKKGNQTDKAIINALINLTRSMELPLVGTHIDSLSLEQTFKTIGGEQVQGKLFSRGVVFEELEIWLKRWHEEHPLLIRQ